MASSGYDILDRHANHHSNSNPNRNGMEVEGVDNCIFLDKVPVGAC